jgi:TolA-binding protein
MSTRKTQAVALGLITVAALALSGCATTGGSSTLENTVRATYDIARDIENDLDGVQHLNATAADLNQQTKDTEQAVRELRTRVEENSVALARIENQLQDIGRAMGANVSRSAPRMDVGAEPEPERTEPPEEPEETRETAAELFRRAQESYIDEDYARARDLYAEYVQRFPEASDAHNAQFWKAQSYFNLAEAQREPELYRQAVSEFDTLQRRFPTSAKLPTAIFNTAAAYFRLGQTEEAIDHLEEVISSHPDSIAARQAQDKLREIR